MMAYPKWLRRAAMPVLHTAHQTGLYRLLAQAYAGCGVIFSFHRVVEPGYPRFHPHHMITAETLEALLGITTGLGWEAVSIDEVYQRLVEGRGKRRFACFTFDDGFADTLLLALPVFRKRQIPLCVNISSGMIERRFFYWWGANHELVSRNDRIELPPFEGAPARVLASGDFTEKQRAFQVMGELCHCWGDAFFPMLREIYARHGVDPDETLDRDALTISQARQLAREPLVTIGAHCVTHRCLARMGEPEARAEIEESRRALERHLEIEVRHLAYPFGRADSCGSREFEMARRAGFRTAVTTRPGNIFPAHRDYTICLPRRPVPIRPVQTWNALYGVESLLRREPRFQTE